MYDRILLPTGGDPGGERAVTHALELARRYDADLRVLYVVDDGALVAETAEVVLDTLERRGRDVVEDVVGRAEDAGVPATGAVRRGRPHRAILDDVETEAIDAVVMGTHGRRGLERYLLGSVAERVVRLSPVPVLTVRMLGESAPGGDDPADGGR